MTQHKILLISISLLILSQSCKKEDNPIVAPSSDNSKVSLSFNSDSILFRGKFYSKTITVDTSELVTVIKNGHAYFYYAAYRTSYEDSLNDTLSAKGVLSLIANRMTASLQLKKLSSTLSITTAGVVISDIGKNNYQFENIKRRWAGIKLTSVSLDHTYFLLPPLGEILSVRLINLIDDPNHVISIADKSTTTQTIADETTCEIFGSMIVIPFIDQSYVDLFDKVKAAYAADKDFYTKIQMVDALTLALDLVEEIVGVFPGCGDLIGSAALEPVRLSLLASISRSTNQGMLRDAYKESFQKILESTIKCACTGLTAGVCGILNSLLETVLLIPELIDHGLHIIDITTTEPYGIINIPLINLTGTWKGILTQPGYVFETYNLTMNLSQSQLVINGTTHSEVPNSNYWAETELTGSLAVKVFKFNQTRITGMNQLPWPYFWILISGELNYRRNVDSLIGTWNTNAGEIKLHRASSN